MVDEDLVTQLHDAALIRWGGKPGILNRHQLLAALARPFAGFGDHIEYPTVYDKAAALAHGIARDHAFVDGNKRTALLTAAAWLDTEGLCLIAPPETSTSTMIELAEGRMTVRQFSQWLRQHSLPVSTSSAESWTSDFLADLQ